VRTPRERHLEALRTDAVAAMNWVMVLRASWVGLFTSRSMVTEPPAFAPGA
jgi:hypothetical protein